MTMIDRRRWTVGDPITDSNTPEGPIEDAWDTRRFELKLVNPANRRKHTVIIVGTGLAGGAAAASLGEMGYNVKAFCYQDSPRRAHSIAAQGGINAAKNYRNDGDSIYRLFYDTVKGGDFRARERNVYRLAQLSRRDHRPVRRAGRAVRPRVRRAARQPLVRRRAGQPHLLRPRPDRPAAAARRVPSARAPDRRRHGRDAHAPRDARPHRGRRPRPRHRRPRHGHRRDRDAHGRRGRARAPAATATSSSCRPTPWAATPRRSGARTARARCSATPATRRSIRPASRCRASTSRSSRSCRSRCATTAACGCRSSAATSRRPNRSPRSSATTTSSGAIPPSATSCPATSHRAPPRRCATKVAASARAASACTSTSATPSTASARRSIRERYDNLFEMYERITDENPYKQPMRIYPAVHYTMGGLWVDYNLHVVDPRLVRRSAKPTSPITAPTASVPRR